MELRHRALQALRLADPEQKVAAALEMQARAATSSIADSAIQGPSDPSDLPGRPARPELLAHTAVARRSPATPEGRAILIHAIAHIEFNAIKTVYNESSVTQSIGHDESCVQLHTV